MPSFDLLIRNAQIIDGQGNPWFRGDLAVKGDRIAALAAAERISPLKSAETLEAEGLALAPGFVDIQSHSILPLMRDGRCLSKILQGVTTEIMGETWTPAPHGGKCEPLPGPWAERAKGWNRFGDWLRAMVQEGVSPNIGSFLSAGTLRSLVRGLRMGPAGSEERAAMCRILADSMRDGAFGISFALIYPPDTYMQTEEIVELARETGRHGGLYISHIRSESGGLLEALDEALHIGREARVPVEVYHLKATGRPNWPKMEAAIEKLAAARAGGQDVTACMYPYLASGTELDILVPSWALSENGIQERLRDPEQRRKIVEQMLADAARSGGPCSHIPPESVMPVGLQVPEHRPYIGKRLSEIAALRGRNWAETVLDLIQGEGQAPFTIYFLMSEENLQRQLRLPWIKVASDAGAYDPRAPEAGCPVHPRSYGTFPRVLGHYVRELGVLTLEDAVRKMTSAPANRLGLFERGRLAPGCFADLVLFDPERVQDRATFEDSHQLAVGIQEVWVNGVRVVRAGAHCGAKPGRFLTGPGYAG